MPEPGMDHVAFQVGPRQRRPFKCRFEELGVERAEVKVTAS